MIGGIDELFSGSGLGCGGVQRCVVGSGALHGAGVCGRLKHALGATLAANTSVCSRASGKSACCDHHYHHGVDTCGWGDVGRFSQVDTDRVWAFDSIWGIVVLPVVLFVQRGCVGMKPVVVEYVC